MNRTNWNHVLITRFLIETAGSSQQHKWKNEHRSQQKRLNLKKVDTHFPILWKIAYVSGGDYSQSAVKMAIGRLCFCSRYFWPSILFLLLNVTSPGNEEKGKTILHRPMSFGFRFANVSSDLRLLLLDGHVCKVRHFGLKKLPSVTSTVLPEFWFKISTYACYCLRRHWIKSWPYKLLCLQQSNCQ